MTAQSAQTVVKPGADQAAVPMPVAVERRRIRPGHVIAAVLLGILIALPVPFGSFGYFIGQFALVYAILGLSVVVVTGYAGMISLMPYSFAGIGAVVTGAALASWGWPFWLAAPLAALATVPISIMVGVTSVRLKGLYLAIATLTFSNALGETFFKWEQAVGGETTGWTVRRPVLGPIDFAADGAYYLFLIGVVFVLVWMVEGLRTSRMGRAMIAVRDNELEAQALGINVYKTKLAAFLLSGLIAGLGGSFLALLLTTVTPEGFQSPTVEVTSILLVSLVVIGGINRAIGAFFGAVALVIQQQVFAGAEVLFAIFGIYASLLLILFLIFRPGGIVQVIELLTELTRRRPALGIGISAAIIVINVGGAWAIVRYLS